MFVCVLSSARTCFSFFSSFDDDKTFDNLSIELLTFWLRPRLCTPLGTEQSRALSGLGGSEATGQLVHDGLKLYICWGSSELDWVMTVVYEPPGLVPNCGSAPSFSLKRLFSRRCTASNASRELFKNIEKWNLNWLIAWIGI
jgi:hypothetical protein